MASVYGEQLFFSVGGDGGLVGGDGRGGFDGGAHDQRASVTDSSQDPSGMVGTFFSFAGQINPERIIVGGSGGEGCTETVPDLYPF